MHCAIDGISFNLTRHKERHRHNTRNKVDFILLKPMSNLEPTN